MSENPILILLPVLAIVALTFIGFVRMTTTRLRAMKGGQDPAYYRAHIGTPEPEFAVAASRHYSNLFELPTVFYAACLTAFEIRSVSLWILIFAWGYVAGRVVQSAVHITYNNPAHRGISFSISVLFLIALWVDIGWHIFGLL
jgi:hypothetical protein